MKTCFVCSAKTQQFSIKDKNFFICKKCQFVSKDQFLTANEEKAHYDNHNNSIEDKRYVEYFVTFLNASVFPFSKAKVAFDFGSGPSPVLAQILQRDYGFQVDIYDKFYAQDKIYKDRKYPIILCTEVIEHIENPHKIFMLFSQLLEQGGIIALMTLFHPQVKEKFSQWSYILDKTHISFFSLQTFEYLAKKYRFVIAYSDKKKYITFKKM